MRCRRRGGKSLGDEVVDCPREHPSIGDDDPTHWQKPRSSKYCVLTIRRTVADALSSSDIRTQVTSARFRNSFVWWRGIRQVDGWGLGTGIGSVRGGIDLHSCTARLEKALH